MEEKKHLESVDLEKLAKDCSNSFEKFIKIFLKNEKAEYLIVRKKGGFLC